MQTSLWAISRSKRSHREDSTKLAAGMPQSLRIRTGLTLGESFPASLGIQSRVGQIPLAGTVKIPVTTTPTLGGVHTASEVYAPDIEQNLSIVVPKVVNAEITETGPLGCKCRR